MCVNKILFVLLYCTGGAHWKQEVSNVRKPEEDCWRLKGNFIKQKYFPLFFYS